MTHAYWVRFSDRGPVCVEGDFLSATERAKELGKVIAVDSLPYPAEPRDEKTRTDCPSFCYRPNQCAGRTACPQRPSCVD